MYNIILLHDQTRAGFVGIRGGWISLGKKATPMKYKIVLGVEKMLPVRAKQAKNDPAWQILTNPALYQTEHEVAAQSAWLKDGTQQD